MDLSLLTADIFHDILSRLPVNMLVQQQYVSKHWQRLILDPNLVQLQMTRELPSSVSGYFFQERLDYVDVDAKEVSYIPIGTDQPKIYHNVLAFLPENVVVLGSSNGLICCRSCTPCDKLSVYVCNPVTKKWITLSWGKSRSKHQYVGFSFEPSYASVVDAIQGCKLVRVSEIDEFTPNKENFYFAFEVYDWRRQTWVESKEICHCEDSICSNKSVFCRGVVYWLTDGPQILSYDVENGLSLLIQLPNVATHDDDRLCSEICIGEANGVLHCIMVKQSGFQDWALMDQYSSEWDLKNIVPLELMEEENKDVLCNLVERVTKCSYNENDPWIRPWAFRDGFLFLKISHSAYSYHIETRKLKWLCTMSDLGPWSYINPIVIPYSMSLASFGGRTTT